MLVRLFLLTLLLTSCSSNWPFYAPSHTLNPVPKQYSEHITELWITTASGNHLNAQFHSTKVQNKQGVVLHFHGNRGNMTESIEKVEWLLNEGFDLLIFDYSGYGKSTGTPSPETTYRDAQALLSTLISLPSPHRNYKKIVWGTSLGGAIMVSGLSTPETSLNLDLIIIDSSFYNYTDMAGSVVANYPLSSLYAWAVGLVIDDSYSPKGKVKHLPQTPILVSHCTTDTLIPIRFSQQIYDEALGTKAFWQLPNCRHARSFANEHPDNQRTLLPILLQPSLINRSLTFNQAYQNAFKMAYLPDIKH